MLLLDLVPVNPVEIFIREWWPFVVAAAIGVAVVAAVIIIITINKNKGNKNG